MRLLRQSTSVSVPIGPFLDATDAVTAETALTITQPDVRLKKNGGAWAQKNAAQTLPHQENGYYDVTLDATDTNAPGLMRLAVHESGALPVWEDFIVLTQNVWDALFGSAKLQVAVAELGEQARTEVHAETVRALVTDTYDEPGQIQPPQVTSIERRVAFLYKGFSNKKTQTLTLFSLFNRAGTVVDQKAPASDLSGTTTIQELVTGP
jgi:hypothetical protein